MGAEAISIIYRCQKGLSAVHSDKSAENICKLRQQRSQRPSCLAYIVLDDGLPVIDCNMICECSVTATRQGSPLVQLKPPATQILTALLLQQRRLDRPLGTAHSAAVKCQLIQRNLRPSKSHSLQFPQWNERSFSVRSGQTFWTFGGLPSHKVPPIKSQCRSADLRGGMTN